MYQPQPLTLRVNWRATGQLAWQALKIIAANILLVMTILFLLEAGIRAFYPEITPLGTDGHLVAPRVYLDSPAPRPNSSGLSCGVEFRVDQRGFWKYHAAFDSTRPAWLLLGDSVTMGMGVTPDSTFAGRLARRTSSNILNAALIGYTSTDYCHIVEALFQSQPPRGQTALHIERITLFWCLNDVYANVGGFSMPGQTVRRLSGNWLRYLKLHWRTYQWIKAMLFDRSRDYYLHDKRFYAEAGAHLQAALQDVQKIHALAQRYQLRFEVVLLPYEYQLRRENEDWVPQEMMRNALQQRRIPVYDAADFLRHAGSEPAALYRFGDGIHFSPRGHAVLAQYLQHLPHGSPAH